MHLSSLHTCYKPRPSHYVSTKCNYRSITSFSKWNKWTEHHMWHIQAFLMSFALCNIREIHVICVCTYCYLGWVFRSWMWGSFWFEPISSFHTAALVVDGSFSRVKRPWSGVNQHFLLPKLKKEYIYTSVPIPCAFTVGYTLKSFYIFKNLFKRWPHWITHYKKTCASLLMFFNKWQV